MTKKYNDETIQQLQIICGEKITKQRAMDLLEAANASLERAIDIFFHQEEEQQQQQQKQKQQQQQPSRQTLERQATVQTKNTAKTTSGTAAAATTTTTTTTSTTTKSNGIKVVNNNKKGNNKKGNSKQSTKRNERSKSNSGSIASSSPSKQQQQQQQQQQQAEGRPSKQAKIESFFGNISKRKSANATTATTTTTTATSSSSLSSTPLPTPSLSPPLLTISTETSVAIATINTTPTLAHPTNTEILPPTREILYSKDDSKVCQKSIGHGICDTNNDSNKSWGPLDSLTDNTTTAGNSNITSTSSSTSSSNSNNGSSNNESPTTNSSSTFSIFQKAITPIKQNPNPKNNKDGNVNSMDIDRNDDDNGKINNSNTNSSSSSSGINNSHDIITINSSASTTSNNSIDTNDNTNSNNNNNSNSNTKNIQRTASSYKSKFSSIGNQSPDNKLLKRTLSSSSSSSSTKRKATKVASIFQPKMPSSSNNNNSNNNNNNNNNNSSSSSNNNNNNASNNDNHINKTGSNHDDGSGKIKTSQSKTTLVQNANTKNKTNSLGTIQAKNKTKSSSLLSSPSSLSAFTFEKETSFQQLADTLQQMADTTKRLVKLAVLEKFIRDIIDLPHINIDTNHNVLKTSKKEDNTDNNYDIKMDKDANGTSCSNDEGSTSTAAKQVRQQQQQKAKIIACALQLVLGRPSSTDQAPLDVSGSSVSKCLQTILGVSRMQISKVYRKYGDLGDIAASLYQKQAYSFFVAATTTTTTSSSSGGNSRRDLSILNVSNSLQSIVQTNGRDAKQQIVLQLMRKCQSKSEIRFLVRLLVCNMRVGASLKTVLAALAMAATKTNRGGCDNGNDNDIDSGTTTITTTNDKQIKANIELVQKTHDICPNLERIIYALLTGGTEQMKRECGIQVLTPIGPMLAHPIHSLDQIQKAMETKQNSMVMEWKYDGVRCQAHYDGTTIKLFSRHMLETTEQYPDAAKSILDAFDISSSSSSSSSVSSFIIDAEIVGVEGGGGDGGEGDGDNNSNKERMLPFQELSKRKRKNDDGQGVRVKVFAFDLMYLNGISYIHKPLWERQEVLRTHFQSTNDFDYVRSQVLPSYNETTLRQFLEQAVENGAEGLMMKMMGKLITDNDDPSSDTTNGNEDKINNNSNGTNTTTSAGDILETSPYEAGTRSHSWLKVKRDYVAGYADTIDVVPIGAWYGNGRKAQKSFLSPVLLAVYDDEEDVFRSISRCMTFSDEMYEAMREFYFRGTPYPPGAGNAGNDGNDTTKGNGQTSEGGVNDDDGDGGDAEQDDIDSEDEKGADDDAENNKTHASDASYGDGEDMVNCYPTRPSSAYVVTNESPSIWFKPLEVFEVSFADMSLSRQHTAAEGLLGDPENRGVALRFPRFKRRRPDKKPNQATTCAQIAELFAKQSKQLGGTTGIFRAGGDL